MSAPLRRVHRLCLGAQHQLVDDRLVRRALDALQHLIEVPGPQALPGRQLVPERCQKVAQVLDALRLGLVVHAIHGRHLGIAEFDRRRDVGSDHELLDDLVRIKVRARMYVGHVSVRPQSHDQFGRDDLQRLALPPRLHQHLVGAPNRGQQLLGHRVAAVVVNLLRLLVGQAHGRTHETAVELVA
mgnify:CR=1 FL=1